MMTINLLISGKCRVFGIDRLYVEIGKTWLQTDRNKTVQCTPATIRFKTRSAVHTTKVISQPGAQR